MNNFLLFAGDETDRTHGAEDFYTSFKTSEEAVEYAKTVFGRGYHWWHVFDIEKSIIVARKRS